MRAEELMVGDWVKTIHDVELRVEGNGMREALNVLLEDALYYSEDDIEPIPITPEILEKNGFRAVEYTSEYEEYVSVDKRVRFNHLSNTIGRDWYCHIDNEDMETIGGADIQYVHELQHLFKLCGVEKEIEL